ncbi:MAG: isopeptide-forming domain-containing fimbrial protein, partial [Clostridia bacterium]
EYIANVKNISNVTDSIYMALTVPTNKYNPIETSNNSQPAHINWITSFFPSAVIYYQTEANATSADILAMKQINQPSATLADYYNSVIVNNWVLHHENDTLPSDVVMAVAYCPNLAKGAIARVDFSATVQMDALTTETFVNESAFNYYSSASTLETQSNKVSIQNFTLVNNIKIEKSPLLQSIDGINGATGSFAISFDMPQNAGAFDSITFFDQLPPALTLLSSSTLQIGDAAPVALGATINSAKLVSKTFTNLAEMAGKSVLISLNISVDKANLIPTSLNDTNQASLIINGNSEFVSLSNIVNVNYVYKNDFDLTKQPLTQNHEKTAGEKIAFEIFFKVPKDISSITKMVITDILHPALQYDAANSLLQIGTTSVRPLNADLTNNTITVNFTQFSSSADQLIKITLATILNNPAVLPESNKIENFATITINDIPAYSFVSNTVTATFGKQVQKIPISKFPPSQQIKKTLGAVVPFVFAFSLPPQIDGYNTIKITDVLAPCLSFDAGGSTIKIGQNSPLPLVAIVTGSLVTIDLVVTKEMAGKIVTINFGTTLFDISKIPTSNQIANVCELMINNDQTLISESNKVEVLFIDIPAEKNPQKTSDTKNFEISKDKIINFKIKFFSKFVQLQNMKMLIMDAIDPALQIISYSLDLPASPSITIVDQTSLNTIAFSIETSFPLGASEPFPEFFNLTITAKYMAETVKDENYVIKNSAQISFGSAPSLLSNEILIPTLCQGEQAIADLIESVALEQAALSHIINAEGEKIQAMLKMPNVTSANLLAANKSVEKMIKSISMLEMLLLKKLEIAKANISKCKQRNK